MDNRPHHETPPPRIAFKEVQDPLRDKEGQQESANALNRRKLYIEKAVCFEALASAAAISKSLTPPSTRQWPGNYREMS